MVDKRNGFLADPFCFLRTSSSECEVEICYPGTNPGGAWCALCGAPKKGWASHGGIAAAIVAIVIWITQT